MTRRHRKHCQAMTLSDLTVLIRELEPTVREASSLLECAKAERKAKAAPTKRGMGDGQSSEVR
jgi:hypothetical protein